MVYVLDDEWKQFIPQWLGCMTLTRKVGGSSPSVALEQDPADAVCVIQSVFSADAVCVCVCVSYRVCFS